MSSLRLIASLSLCGALALAWSPAPASACGGFFCSQQPVDQQAERILFAVDESSVTMIVQIEFRGKAEEFAWVLPVTEVPPRESFDTFPARAITALDANTAPMFVRPDDPECGSLELDGGGPPESTPGVTVHIQDVVGPYEVAVIESADPEMLVTWLRMNHYRVSDAMVPAIAEYTAAGMKLLALRLARGRDTTDIEPFRLTIPGTTTPSIPLKLTAIAAEPEMGILVFVLGDMRYGPASWPEVDVDPARLIWSPYAWPAETNYTALVARAVDDAGGQGFVTELAQPTDALLEQVMSAPVRDEEDMQARDALAGLLSAHPYITRMYSRLSAEEMTSDPIFRRHGGGDVARERMMSRMVDGRDLCLDAPPACDFVTCGAGGSCEEVEVSTFERLPGCRCDEGLTARTTFAPGGQGVVVCQDPATSVLMPGDRSGPGEEPLPDPCVGFDCGDGECLAVNLTPTCRCAADRVAIGWLDSTGERHTRCVDPAVALPEDPRRELPPIDPRSPTGPPTTPPPAAFTPRGGGCAVAGDVVPAVPAVILLVSLGFLRVRRRRR